MVFLPIKETYLPDSLKDHKGISVVRGDGNGEGVLVDPKSIDVLALLKAIRTSEMDTGGE